MTELTITEIKQYLPHRYPFLMLDRVLEIQSGEGIVALKNVTANEYFFAGHFPQQPVMPGVLIIEALAQAGGVFAAYDCLADMPEGSTHFLAGVDNARFKSVVTPGDQLRLEVRLTAYKKTIFKMHGEASVNGQLACSVDLISAVRQM